MASKRDFRFGPGEPQQASSSLHVQKLGDTTASAIGHSNVMYRLQGDHRRKLSEIYGPHVHGHQDDNRTSVTFEPDAKRQRSIIRDTEDDYSELGSGTVTAPLNFSLDLEHLDRFRASYKLPSSMVDRFLNLFQYDGPKRSFHSGSHNHISIARKMQPHDASEETVKEVKSSHATLKPSPWNRCW